MNDLTVTKYLTEEVRNKMREGNVNHKYADKYKNQFMLEGIAKTGPMDYDKIDWFVRPEQNGTNYLTNKE